MFVRPLLAALGSLAVAAAPLGAQSPKEAVLAAAQGVFDAMGARDSAALGRLLHPAAHLIATVERGDSVLARATDRAAFMAQVAGSPVRLLERMWNAEVKVSGTVASVWTSYDFHRDGVWSHCGIDAFQLVRTQAGWQVSSIIYTIVADRARCGSSPLGPPK